MAAAPAGHFAETPQGLVREVLFIPGLGPDPLKLVVDGLEAEDFFR